MAQAFSVQSQAPSAHEQVLQPSPAALTVPSWHRAMHGTSSQAQLPPLQTQLPQRLGMTSPSSQAGGQERWVHAHCPSAVQLQVLQPSSEVLVLPSSSHSPPGSGGRQAISVQDQPAASHVQLLQPSSAGDVAPSSGQSCPGAT